jgi:hypothetical protein
MTPDALDIIPWESVHLLSTLDVPQMIPPMESVAIGLKMIISRNTELGRKDFPRSALMLCL